jgi:hypothetical protein
MDQWLNIVSNLGFPIVVSVFLMVRIESRIEELSKSINELSKALASLK